MEIKKRLADLLFNPVAWFPTAQGDNAVATYYLKKTIDLKTFKEDNFLKRQHDHFSLLSIGEWLTLGFAVALTPYMLSNTMDNKLKRLISTRFTPTQIERMDAIATTRPKPALGRQAWEKPDALAIAGIAAVANTLNWHPEVAELHATRFTPTQPAVENLNIVVVEELCKILLPELPWLVSSEKASTSPPIQES